MTVRIFQKAVVRCSSWSYTVGTGKTKEGLPVQSPEVSVDEATRSIRFFKRVVIEEDSDGGMVEAGSTWFKIAGVVLASFSGRQLTLNLMVTNGTNLAKSMFATLMVTDANKVQLSQFRDLIKCIGDSIPYVSGE